MTEEASKTPTLAARIRAAFTAMQKDAPGERFYFFALRTTRDGAFVGAVAFTEGARRSHDAAFVGLTPGKKLHDACFDALREVDGDRLFGKGVARSKLLINVIYDEMSDEQWLVNADRLNSRAAVERALRWRRGEP